MPAKPPFEYVHPAVRVLLFWTGVFLSAFGLHTVDSLQEPDLQMCRAQGECVRISQAKLAFARTTKAFTAATDWKAPTRQRAIESLRADSWILVPGYVLLLSVLCGAAARRRDQRTYGRPGIAIAWLVFVAGAADLAENTLIDIALGGADSTTLGLLLAAAIVKWSLVAIAGLYATVAPLSRWVHAHR